MVLHVRRVALGIENNFAVSRYPCETARLFIYAFEIVKPVFLNGGRCQRKFGLQIVFLHRCEVAVKDSENQHKARRKNDCGNRDYRTEYFFRHCLCPFLSGIFRTMFRRMPFSSERHTVCSL